MDPAIDDDLLSCYDYHLPAARIARRPADRRDHSRLLVHDRGRDETRHRAFHELTRELRRGDLLVWNDCRVVPARLLARRAGGGRVEVLLHPTGVAEPCAADGRTQALALLRPSARLRAGEELTLEGGATLRVEDPPGAELRRVTSAEPLEVLLRHGQVPLPPYLGREADPEDQVRYQTVFARAPGAVAAPTAGLHFTPELLEQLRAQGVATTALTLFVGPGTFLPVRTERLSQHAMHEEEFEIPAATAEAIARARAEGGRVVAVGTTTTRALESAAGPDGAVAAGRDRTRLMIRPPYRFRVVDVLLTNFHLPQSTLLALVAAFAGRERVLSLYEEAVRRDYRFYSYGDAMLIL